MGVVTTARNTVVTTVALAVAAVVGFHVMTKQDTSKDRSATVVVKLASDRLHVYGNVSTFINTAERSSDPITDKNPTFGETFWVRPGEKVSVVARLFQGRGVLTCQIILDGAPAAGPVVSRNDFEASCEAQAVA